PPSLMMSRTATRSFHLLGMAMEMIEPRTGIRPSETKMERLRPNPTRTHRKRRTPRRTVLADGVEGSRDEQPGQIGGRRNDRRVRRRRDIHHAWRRTRSVGCGRGVTGGLVCVDATPLDSDPCFAAAEPDPTLSVMTVAG